MRTAALYLRSSKDRSDISIAAQRTELKALALSRGLAIAAEYADSVFSGKDEERPGFQKLLSAIRNPNRGWETILVLDTSRVARRRYIAVMFEHEVQRRRIELVYKSVPDTDPVTGIFLKSMLQAVDEWTSMTSRAKGLAGMAENVRQGWRAGGRPPLGYRLEHIETGAVREGQPVRKSRLVLAPDADKVQAYLRQRAIGVPRARAGLPGMKASSLVGVEWNALTYAGHTAWNVHAEAGSGRKRRPRKEWLVQRDTHEALIEDSEAESILARLEAYTSSRSRDRGAGYLLAGLLVTPDGVPYHGDRGAYRVKGRQVQAERVDRAVAEHVLADLQAPRFVKAVTQAARAMRKPQDTTQAAREALAGVEAKLARLVALVEQTDAPGPLLRRMEALEAERAQLAETLAEIDADASRREALASITEMEVRRLLVERAAAIEDAEPEAMRAALAGLLDRVEFDGDELRLHYRIGRDKLASPRGAEPIPLTVARPLPRMTA